MWLEEDDRWGRTKSVKMHIVDRERLSWNLGDNSYVVKAPVEWVRFSGSNAWNFNHARALFEMIEDGSRPVFRVPAGIFRRITQHHVEHPEEFTDYGGGPLGMRTPFTSADIGGFYIELIDGHHRSLAAIAAGEPNILIKTVPLTWAQIRDAERVDLKLTRGA